MSSWVNLSLLVNHVNTMSQPYNGLDPVAFLYPNLKFKFLYSGSTLDSDTNALPPALKRHIPESFLSFDIFTKDLPCFLATDGDNALRAKVRAAFIRKVSIYASLLRCKMAKPPEEILSILLPFIYGDIFSGPQLGDVIAAVKGIVNLNINLGLWRDKTQL